MKNRIRLTESQLHQVIKESVNNILAELKVNPEAWAIKAREYSQDDNKRKQEINGQNVVPYLYDRANKSWNARYGQDGTHNFDLMQGNIKSKYPAYGNNDDYQEYKTMVSYPNAESVSYYQGKHKANGEQYPVKPEDFVDNFCTPRYDGKARNQGEEVARRMYLAQNYH